MHVRTLTAAPLLEWCNISTRDVAHTSYGGVGGLTYLLLQPAHFAMFPDIKHKLKGLPSSVTICEYGGAGGWDIDK